MDEQAQTMMLTMELEDTRLKAQEEIKLRDNQITQLKELLTSVIKERDEAQINCQRAFLEKLLLQQELHKYPTKQQHSGISSIELEDDPHHHHYDHNQNHNNPRVGTVLDSSNNGFTSSDCDESIVSSPQQTNTNQELQLPVHVTKPLPEKGKLLEAVMKAGPLLQTLLLAGPLPQWRHPPPPLETYQIPPPPVAIHQDGSRINNCGMKRSLPEECNVSPSDYKYQRIVLQ